MDDDSLYCKIRISALIHGMKRLASLCLVIVHPPGKTLQREHSLKLVERTTDKIFWAAATEKPESGDKSLMSLQPFTSASVTVAM